jgi:phosphoserine phosphatase
MSQKVFVNRTLNLKRIRYVGLDMDHTLIRYNSEAFERLSHSVMKEKLVKNKHYPEVVKNLNFDFSIAIPIYIFRILMSIGKRLSPK